MINKQHKKNLESAIKLLEENKEKIEKKFDMSVHCRDKWPTVRMNFYSQKDCGTIHCCLGWIATLGKGELKPKDGDFTYDRDDILYDGRETLCFNRYSERVFGLTRESSEDRFREDFLFGGGWKTWDNTLEGAIKRIKYYLSHYNHSYVHYRSQDFKKGWKL